jgi:sugar lactone lactonase YvrE
MLFYGRYARNEAYIALYGVLTLFAILKYLDTGQNRYLLLLTVVTSLQFATKETAYIYTAQAMIFLALVFMVRVARVHWPNKRRRDLFTILLFSALVLITFAILLSGYYQIIKKYDPTSVAGLEWLNGVETVGVGAGIPIGIIAMAILIHDIGWKVIKRERAFQMLLLLVALVLPLLTALGVKFFGSIIGQAWDPLDYSTVGIVHTVIFLVLFALISFGVGLLWDLKRWLANMAVFYGIFTVLYTTFFTNTFGFFTGIVGALGYWLAQQADARGTQPFYYYVLVQMPVYEFLAIFGALLAVYFGLRYHKFATYPGDSPARSDLESGSYPAGPDYPPYFLPLVEMDENVLPEDDSGEDVAAGLVPENERLLQQNAPVPTLALFVFWAITALVAYTFSGEKMPWLTVHIALPFLLCAAWGFGYLVDTTHWSKLKENNAWVAVLLLPVFITSLGMLLGSLLGTNPPFQGDSLDQLRGTSDFIISAAGFLLSGWGILHLLREWSSVQTLRLFVGVLAVFLAVLTVRTAYRANYIKEMSGMEYLVYAHSPEDPKDVYNQVVDISKRITGGLDLKVAYDEDALYPYWWYLHNFPNHYYFGKTITSDLRNYPIILAGTNLDKLDRLTQNTYISFDYIRLVWPNEDYNHLTWDRIWGALSSPDYRAALFQIWFNRDYTEYATLTNSTSFTDATWQPSNPLRMYVSKDIVSQIWNYGTVPAAAAPEQTDPYLSGMIQLTPDQVIGQTGSQPGQLQSPRGIALAPDGSIYVADAGNNRIEHFAADGTFINAWGSTGVTSDTQVAPNGTFNEPWGVAVDKDGYVYVADTWNYRIQKFTPDGQFVASWGSFGQGDQPDALYGPRDIAFDSQGRLFVADTGNKRIVVFDPDGTYVTQFGSAGIDPGQFDENVGIAIDANDKIYVADTWNQRVQVLSLDSSTNQITPLTSWDVSGWTSQSLDNKPYIAVDEAGHVFVTDPEGFRVLEFSQDGQFIQGWGDYSTATDGLNLPTGIKADGKGGVWVSDAGNNVLLHFTVPEATVPAQP